MAKNQVSSCTISEKTNDAILRKLSDGRTDGETDGQTDESDFIGHCPTNVERPTYFLIKLPSVKFLLKSTHPLCQTNH